MTRLPNPGIRIVAIPVPSGTPGEPAGYLPDTAPAEGVIWGAVFGAVGWVFLILAALLISSLVGFWVGTRRVDAKADLTVEQEAGKR